MRDRLLEETTVSVMTLRNANFIERVEAVSAAKFGGMALRLSDFEEGQAQLQLQASEIAAYIGRHGLAVREIEFLREWIGQERNTSYRRKETSLFEMATYLDQPSLNVGVFQPYPMEDVVRSFRGLCERASDYGLQRVQMEFMPYTPPINSLQAAGELIERVDRANAKLIVDTWQWLRTPNADDDLADIQPECITGIQLSDALPNPLPNVVEESRHHRLPPGEGCIDFYGFLTRLHEHGVDIHRTPFSVEVMSDHLDAMHPTKAALRVATGLNTLAPAFKRLQL